MAVSSTSMKVASMTAAAMSQGFTPWVAEADWSSGAMASAGTFRSGPFAGADVFWLEAGMLFCREIQVKEIGMHCLDAGK